MVKIVAGANFQHLLFYYFCDQILVFNFLVYALKQNSSKYSFTALLLFDARRKPTNPINFLLYLGLNLISCVYQLRQLALCKQRAESSSFWNLFILMRSFCPEFKYCLDEMLCFLWYCNFFPHSEILRQNKTI